ncbi:enoyl-CoA hydratase/isomerase family protein [Rhodococcus sp. WAY2]|uniref:enoyl-CoA hydratase/isomerase family protein n=1 Tax=Rhodococcus sp. WAY2 TaxID=2663121 RepID=UPI0013200E6A|nr:enoyl-CoA hydratase/isomerase family protein [Rhodococcus sp. WAY2]QHE73312.1 Enoyl-CoA hydratase [Rhodococcus sp. WAY2]
MNDPLSGHHVLAGERLSKDSLTEVDLAPSVTLEVVGSVAVVRMERPAIDSSTRLRLIEVLDEVATDGSVAATVLTGTGRVFAAGQDLHEHRRALKLDATTATQTLQTEYRPLLVRLACHPKPVVAAVNGVCAGGGLGLALACDLRIASSTARFVPAFLDLRLAPDCGVSELLGRVIGWGRARQVLLTGEAVSPDDAKSWGLVSAVVPEDELMPKVMAVAGRFVDAAAAVRATRTLLDAAENRASLTDALAREQVAQAELARNPAHVVAVEDVSAALRRRR